MNKTIERIFREGEECNESDSEMLCEMQAAGVTKEDLEQEGLWEYVKGCLMDDLFL